MFKEVIPLHLTFLPHCQSLEYLTDLEGCIFPEMMRLAIFLCHHLSEIIKLWEVMILGQPDIIADVWIKTTDRSGDPSLTR